MKKRFLSILTALCLTLTLLPTAALAAGDTGETCDSGAECDHFAEIGDLHYDTLAGAVAAVTDDTETTIKLLKNANGDGIKVTTGKKIIFDLNNCTYNIDGTTVGSTGTETNGFQLLKGSTVTFKNGTLTSNKAKILIQNYSNLTLDQVKLDGSQIAGKNYTLSNNCGDVLIKDSTITAPASGYAFDVFFWPPSYAEGVSVTVENSTINGPIECTEQSGISEEGKNTLVIRENTTINGDIDIKAVESVSISDARVNGNITNTDTDGSVLVQSSVVTGTVATTAVVIDSTNGAGVSIDQVPDGVVATVGGKNYSTIKDAIDAAGDGDTVTLLANVTESITIGEGETIVLDLNGHTLTNTEGSHTITNNGALTVQDTSAGGTGTVDNVTHARGALVNYGTAELEGGKFTRSAETSKSPTDNGGNSWYVIDNQGTMTIDGATVKNTGHYSSLIRNVGKSASDTAKLTVSSGLIQQDNFIALKNDDYGVLTVKGGTIISDEQALQNWSQAELSGGTFDGNVITWSYENHPSSTMISDDAKITGNVIAVNYDNNEESIATVNITGGTVVGEISKGTYSGGIVPADPNVTTSEIQVSRRHFSSSVDEEFLAEKFTAELYSTAKNPAAPYSYYESVADAQAAAQPGDVITDLNPDEGGDPVKYYTITLNNGNTIYNTYFIKAGEIFTLPSAPSGSSNQRFDGWSLYGTLYQPGRTFTVDASMTFNAMWTEVSSSGSSSDPSYSPILDVSDGGSIKVNPRTPEEDDEVTITVDPDSGYEVDKVTVTDRNGREVKVTAERDGTYTFTQPRGRVTISVTFVREGGSTFFSDVPESFWAYDEIAWAYDNGYVNGTSASSFSPNASISRQQVWMILARLSGADPANMSAAREWAVTNGVSDGTTPGGAVTRQQLVALLYRYATLMGYANDQRADLSAYPDAGTVAGYAVEPMQWSVANSIVGGTSNGTLDPTGTATRAQFAVILYRFWDQVG